MDTNLNLIAVIDNNIIDRLLFLDTQLVSKLNNKVIFRTHYNIFEEAKACNNEERKQSLLQMYPKFEIKTINDNSFPVQFPFTFYSNEAWNMQKLFMTNKSPTTDKNLRNMRNDSLLILMQYENQLSNQKSVLISNNKKDFQNFCKKNNLNWCDWKSFECTL
jgi:hypothetical protein